MCRLVSGPGRQTAGQEGLREKISANLERLSPGLVQRERSLGPAWEWKIAGTPFRFYPSFHFGPLKPSCAQRNIRDGSAAAGDDRIAVQSCEGVQHGRRVENQPSDQAGLVHYHD